MSVRVNRVLHDALYLIGENAGHAGSKIQIRNLAAQACVGLAIELDDGPGCDRKTAAACLKGNYPIFCSSKNRDEYQCHHFPDLVPKPELDDGLRNGAAGAWTQVKAIKGRLLHPLAEHKTPLLNAHVRKALLVVGMAETGLVNLASLRAADHPALTRLAALIDHIHAQPLGNALPPELTELAM